MRLRILFLLSFTAVLLWPCSLSAQNSTAKRGAAIHGTVFDPDGRAVQGAEVTLLGAMTVTAATTRLSPTSPDFPAFRRTSI
jgi:hypothetical protein